MEAYLDEPVLPFAYAPWPRRLASAAIDLIVISAISLPFVAPTVSRVVADSTDTQTASFTNTEYRTLIIIGIVIQIAYFTGMHAWRGSTVGKMATRTVLLRDEGQPVSAGVAFVRAVSLVAINFVSSFLVLIPGILNMLSPMWNPRRQTFHDRLARTIVVMREPAT